MRRGSRDFEAMGPHFQFKGVVECKEEGVTGTRHARVKAYARLVSSKARYTMSFNSEKTENRPRTLIRSSEQCCNVEVKKGMRGGGILPQHYRFHDSRLQRVDVNVETPLLSDNEQGYS